MVNAGQFDWQYHLSDSAAGRAWLTEFRQPQHAEITSSASQALALLHRRQTAPARALLRTAEASLRRVSGSRASIVHVLGRIYHGVLAYHDYFTNRFAEASAELEAAAGCIRRALSSEQIVMPLAFDCSEFCLHHARIARNQERWAAMQTYIDTARDMLDGKRPLCELEDGTIVDFHAIVEHYRSLGLSPEARAGLAPMLEPDLRRDHFERFILKIYFRAGFVVPGA